MRSAEEVRTEIERLRKRFGTSQEHDALLMAWAAARSPALIRKAALEWVLADEQPKPAKCKYCRGAGQKFEAFTMEEEICLHCNGTGDEQGKPKETGE